MMSSSLFLLLLAKSYFCKELCILCVVLYLGEIRRTEESKKGQTSPNSLIFSDSSGAGTRDCIMPIYKFIVLKIKILYYILFMLEFLCFLLIHENFLCQKVFFENTISVATKNPS